VIRVRDSGTGISPEVLPKVFEMFVQDGRAIDRSQGGLGLGLAIVRSLAELHGGTVSAHSDGVGRGSEFVVRLPLAQMLPKDASDVSAASPPLLSNQVALQPLRILIVDDNRNAAKLLAELLEMTGFVTHVAYDGPTALEAAPAFRPDVALLDIGLPIMDGYELAAKLRAHALLRGTRLIALTGYGQESDRRRAQEAGFDFHLVKPVNLEQLLEAIRHLTGAEPKPLAAPG
jgi:CheY-like chemotaxis protein